MLTSLIGKGRSEYVLGTNIDTCTDPMYKQDDQGVLTYITGDEGPCTRIQAWNMRNDTDNGICTVTKDFGDQYFGNFEVEITFKKIYGQGDSLGTILLLSNLSDATMYAADVVNVGVGLHCGYNIGQDYIQLRDLSNNDKETTYGAGRVDPVYLTMHRTGGATTLDQYTDSARTNLAQTHTVTTGTVYSYRYLTMMASYGSPTQDGDTIRYYTESCRVITGGGI